LLDNGKLHYNTINIRVPAHFPNKDGRDCYDAYPSSVRSCVLCGRNYRYKICVQLSDCLKATQVCSVDYLLRLQHSHVPCSSNNLRSHNYRILNEERVHRWSGGSGRHVNILHCSDTRSCLSTCLCLPWSGCNAGLHKR
jgi:hypothetical protein